MPTINCEFVFERTAAIYYSGEQVCGKVTLTCYKDLKVEELQINCKGVANVSWYARARQSPNIEHNDGADEHQQLQYQGHEVYVDETRPLHKHTIIYAGRHEYKFSFKLPDNCPATSARHNFGEIFYSLSLLLKRRTKFDKKFEQRFVVKNRLDLNVASHKYMSPALSSCYMKNIDTEINFSTPLTGYVPGQLIKFCLDVETTTSEIMKNLHCKVRLCQKYTYQCQQPSAVSKDIIWQLDNAKFSYAVQRQEVHHYESSLQVPLLTALTSAQNPARIIGVMYYLEALIFIKHKLLLTKLCIPITVGSEAFKDISHSTCELEHYCYDNSKVENFHEDTTTSISADINKEASQNQLLLTAHFDENSNCNQCSLHNKLHHNNKIILYHYP